MRPARVGREARPVHQPDLPCVSLRTGRIVMCVVSRSLRSAFMTTKTDALDHDSTPKSEGRLLTDVFPVGPFS